MEVAAALLTGGASRRMGRDKAGLVTAATGPETLAVRTARLLRAVADPVIEVGGGHRPAPGARPAPCRRPLVALASATVALRAAGWTGPVLVVATDLPRLTPGMLAWLAGHPAPGGVVPLDADGRPQFLCARYAWADLEQAEVLVARGATRLGDLLARTGATLCPPSEWSGPAGGTDALFDVDTPDDLAALAAATTLAAVGGRPGDGRAGQSGRPGPGHPGCAPEDGRG